MIELKLSADTNVVTIIRTYLSALPHCLTDIDIWYTDKYTIHAYTRTVTCLRPFIFNMLPSKLLFIFMNFWLNNITLTVHWHVHNCINFTAVVLMWYESILTQSRICMYCWIHIRFCSVHPNLSVKPHQHLSPQVFRWFCELSCVRRNCTGINYTCYITTKYRLFCHRTCTLLVSETAFSSENWHL